jgi:hypothetical protein
MQASVLNLYPNEKKAGNVFCCDSLTVASVSSVGRTKAAGIFRSERWVCPAFVRLCWPNRGVYCILPRPGKADQSGRTLWQKTLFADRFGPPYGVTEPRSYGVGGKTKTSCKTGIWAKKYEDARRDYH